MIILIIGISFCLFYVVLEVFQRKTHIDSQITRKFAHIFSGLGVIVGSNYLTRIEFVCLASFFLVLFIISRIFTLQKSILVQQKKGYGEIYFPIILVLLGFFFYNNRSLFIQTLLILSIPDTLSWLPGYIAQSTRKTMAGSWAYFFSALIVLLFFHSLFFSFIAAALLAVVEYYSPSGSDNLTTPVAFLFISYFLR